MFGSRHCDVSDINNNEVMGVIELSSVMFSSGYSTVRH